MVPGSIGQDVVEASIAKVNQIKLFADDSGFLFRLALVESKFGENPQTFADQTNKSPNIWSIDSQKFRETKDIQKHPELLQLYYDLADKYDIDWQRLDIYDMQRPLYSALASKMFLHLNGQPIPETIDDQAQYWKQHYTAIGDGNVDADTFVQEVHKLEDLYECSPHISLCYVLDGSGSIGSSDFQLAKQFLYNVTDKISSENGQFCLVLFSSDAQTIYDFTVTDKTKRLNKIKDLIQPDMSTNTRAGIQKTVDIMETSINQVPYKTMFVLTDGYSDDGVQPAVSNAQKAHIKSWVWGIGDGVKDKELNEIAYNIPDNVKQLTKYSSMDSYLYEFKKTLCDEIIHLIDGQKFDDTSVQNEKRYFSIDLPKTGAISLTIQLTNGNTLGYYAYSTPNPSSAVNDGQLDTNPYNIPGQQQHSQVYVTIVGQGPNNVYSITPTYI
ncbi:integrin alpha-E-like [Oppia nitens]|uniref:integrin alpha-E-like n=1 Tax=Oppia nitens TaxID=1686743 RepID=UPI0023DA440F|nr:integrin alpha-E-like [Oppia nitens]